MLTNNKIIKSFTFDCQLFAFPLFLVPAEAAHVTHANNVIVDVKSQGVKLKELDPKFGNGAVVSDLNGGQELRRALK